MASEELDIQGFARDIHELLILATLRDGAKHGYQIAIDVEDESNGLVRFRHGTLYPILHRLEGEGWIEGSWSTAGGRRRKVYTLTGAGRRHLTGGSHRMDDVFARLLDVLRGPDEALS